MEDIVPELLEKLKRDFENGVNNNAEIRRLRELILNRKGSYIEAEEIAKEIGLELSQSFGKNVSSAVLPGGKMHYNIADRTVRPLLEESYKMATEEAMAVQQVINERAHIGLKVQQPEIDEDRVAGIVRSISNAEHYDDIAWLLDEPLINFTLSAVTDVVRVNFEFHGKAGLNPKIIRKAERKCCKWCSSLAGTYSYPVENRDVFRRHQRCRCNVIYDQGDGLRENVHSKKAAVSKGDAKVEAREILGKRVADKKVKGYSKQVVESLENRNITPQELKDALSKPLNIRQKADTGYTEIIGERCTITMDKSGKIVTAYRTHTATRKQYKPKKKRS